MCIYCMKKFRQSLLCSCIKEKLHQSLRVRSTSTLSIKSMQCFGQWHLFTLWPVKLTTFVTEHGHFAVRPINFMVTWPVIVRSHWLVMVTMIASLPTLLNWHADSEFINTMIGVFTPRLDQTKPLWNYS